MQIWPVTAIGHEPSADDLLVSAGRRPNRPLHHGRRELGLNHTTISRRIAALEQSIGGRVLARVAGGWELTDLGREALSAAEAVESAVRSLTDGYRRRSGPRRRGADLGDRRVQRLHRRPCRRHGPAQPSEGRGRDRRRHPARDPAALRAGHRGRGRRAHGAPGQGDPAGRLLPRPVRLPRLPRRTRHAGEYRRSARYPLVYFIDSMLQVDDLDLATSFAPAMRESVTSTNVFVHVEATRASAGIGLLPCFMADRHGDLVRVLPDAVSVQLTYWLVTRAETLRRPEVAARRRRDPRRGCTTSATCCSGALRSE